MASEKYELCKKHCFMLDSMINELFDAKKADALRSFLFLMPISVDVIRSSSTQAFLYSVITMIEQDDMLVFLSTEDHCIQGIVDKSQAVYLRISDELASILNQIIQDLWQHLDRHGLLKYAEHIDKGDKTIIQIIP